METEAPASIVPDEAMAATDGAVATLEDINAAGGQEAMEVAQEAPLAQVSQEFTFLLSK